MPYIAEDAVVLAIGDPNVGKDREIAIETDSGRLLIGPDNGLLTRAWESDGGVRRAVEIASDEVIEYRSPTPSARVTRCARQRRTSRPECRSSSWAASWIRRLSGG